MIKVKVVSCGTSWPTILWVPRPLPWQLTSWRCVSLVRGHTPWPCRWRYCWGSLLSNTQYRKFRNYQNFGFLLIFDRFCKFPKCSRRFGWIRLDFLHFSVSGRPPEDEFHAISMIFFDNFGRNSFFDDFFRR